VYDHLHILLCEDEFLLLLDMETQLKASGARVVASAARLDELIRLTQDPELDANAALLDLSLMGQSVCPAIPELMRRGIAVVLYTGQTQAALPQHLQHLTVISKPATIDIVLEALATAVA
jgi:CheY-like chemotaxis protein